MPDSSLAALARGDPAGFHQYGQKLYQHGDHVKAIEVFSQVIFESFTTQRVFYSLISYRL